MKKLTAALSLFSLGLVLLSASPASAQPFYQGKTLTIVVGYKAGGGYDTTARLLSRHIGRFIPGNPTVIVQNMPGANSIIAANYVYRVAKPDGLTIGTFNRNLPLAQMTKEKGVEFDITKFSWLGSAASEASVLTIRADLPYKTAEDAKNAKSTIVIGATGPGANTYDHPALLKEYLGFPFKIITGYSSSADIMLAIERKEVDGRSGSYSSLAKFIQRGVVRPIIRTRISIPEIASLPVDENLTTNKDAKALLRVRSAPEEVGRPYVAPPGVPADRLKILREAFEKVLKDPQVLAEGEKAELDLSYTNGEECLKTVKEIMDQPPHIVEAFKKLFAASN